MKERQFAGTLNSKSVYGQSYSNYEVLRTFKYNKTLELQKTSKIWSSWYKKKKGFYPSWGVSLFSVGNYLTFTQRQENQGRKNKCIELLRWK